MQTECKCLGVVVGTNGKHTDQFYRFRWVDCQLEPLRQCPKSKYDLEECLKHLPESLNETYERILVGITHNRSERAQRILSLLCFSSRPLTVGEVIDAIAVDIHKAERYDCDRKLEGADDLLRICPGLIEVGPFHRTVTTDGVVGTQTVRVAHFSVQEYLLSDQIKQSRAADFALSGPMQHAQICKTCLLYLNNDDFVRQTLSPGLLQEYPLAKYAAHWWHYHYRQANTGLDNQIDNRLFKQLSEKILALLTVKNALERWIRLHDPNPLWSTVVNIYNLHKSVFATPTYYAASLGLEGPLAGILSGSLADVNSQGGRYGSPLQAASRCGHEKVVQLLLDKGADVNMQRGVFGSALNAASVNGHEKVVQLLLNHGADMNMQGEEYGNALSTASVAGHDKIVQILLDYGADVNTVGPFGNALQAAESRGHKKVMQLLLDNGAAMNA